MQESKTSKSKLATHSDKSSKKNFIRRRQMFHGNTGDAAKIRCYVGKAVDMTTTGSITKKKSGSYRRGTGAFYNTNSKNMFTKVFGEIRPTLNAWPTSKTIKHPWMHS